MPTKKNARPPAECPLCGYRFSVGTLGWHTHVGNVANHPKWRPDLMAVKARQKQFQEDYPDFFKSAASSNRRVPPSDRREGMGAPSKQLVPDFMRASMAPPHGRPPPNGKAPPPIPGAPLVLDHKATVKSEPRLPVAASSAAAAQESLAEALAEAAKAGKWDVVERLAALLEGSAKAGSSQ